MWALAKLLFSGALEKALDALSAALKWVLSDWRNGPLVLFAAGFFWGLFITAPGLRADVAAADARTARALAEREATMDAFEQTVANYAAASAQAQAQAEANVARVAAAQAEITRETVDDYQSRLAVVRARADELRRSALRTTSSDPGRAGAAGLPGPADPADRADPAPGDPRLPDARDRVWSCPPGFVCLTIDQAEIATAQAHQLDALIDYTLRQAAVPFTTEAHDDE